VNAFISAHLYEQPVLPSCTDSIGLNLGDLHLDYPLAWSRVWQETTPSKLRALPILDAVFNCGTYSIGRSVQQFLFNRLKSGCFGKSMKIDIAHQGLRGFADSFEMAILEGKFL
jgi:hypothetical protein